MTSNTIKDSPNKCLRERIASLRGTRNLAVYRILSRFLRSVRLALHLDQRLIPCILKTMLLVIVLLISPHAQAKLQTFDEVFKGTLPSVKSSEFGFYDEVTTLLSKDATLTLYYQVVSDDPFSSIGSGTFTRTDALGAFSGNFFFYLSLNDYLSSNDQGISLSGFLHQDSGAMLPNTGAYQYAWAFGDAGINGNGGGTIASQRDITLKINWQIRTPEPFPPIPEPEMAWLFSLGLVTLCFKRAQTIIK